jgi:predicted CoA-binding protein
LQAAGYHVIPVTPEQIRRRPTEVLAAIVAALQASGAM